MTRVIEWVVDIPPGPKGSLRMVGRKASGAPRFINDSGAGAKYQRRLAGIVRGSMPLRPDWRPERCAHWLIVRFFWPRPLSHFVGRNRDNAIRPDAPPFPIASRDDVDKLVRATGDALVVGGALIDDGHIVGTCSHKFYRPVHRVEITLSREAPTNCCAFELHDRTPIV